MSNPALNENTFKRVSSVIVDDSKMTIHGTINKAGFLLLIAAFGASLGWNTNSSLLLIGSFIASLVFSLLIIFGPQRAPYFSQAYAFAEGILLGTISSMYAQQFPGIVTNALILTMSCVMITLVLYRLQIVKVNDKFRSVVMIGTMAIMVTYFVDMAMGFFGSSIPMIHQSSPVGIGFSLVIVFVAALNLFLDFNMIEEANRRGAPKFMEWYCGFALMVTLVWLYLEILRLLSKLNKK